MCNFLILNSNSYSYMYKYTVSAKTLWLKDKIKMKCKLSIADAVSQGLRVRLVRNQDKTERNRIGPEQLLHVW